MKLLIVTQRVDPADPILGFFTGWISAFAERFERVTVIGQSVGSFDAPARSSVCSLGKERGRPKLLQVLRFWRLLLTERRSYDCVFVHMTPIWVILGGPIFLLLRKPVYLWYEARGGGWALPLSLRIVRAVFSATPSGMPFATKKSIVTGHGIDTDRFAFVGEGRDPDLVLAVGRVTKVKHLDWIFRAFASLPGSPRLIVAGGAFTPEDEGTLQDVKTLAFDLGIASRVTFGWVAPDELRMLLRRASLLLHAAGGGLDKAVLEAIASGCPVVSASPATAHILPEACQATEASFPETARRIFTMDAAARSLLTTKLRKRIEDEHALSALVDRLTQVMSGH